MKTVLITGASTGIGKSCAFHLAERGFRVIAGVRRPEDGKALADLAPIEWILLDVTDGASIARAAGLVASLDGLVNNAGIVVAGPLEFIPVTEFKKQLDVNVTGLLATTQAFLPLLRKTRGRIINIGSISGRVSFPFLGPYCASKFAVEALSDALRLELKTWGVDVVLIEPGRIQTPIWDKSTGAAEEISKSLPPEADALYGQAMEKLKSQVQWAKKAASPALVVARTVERALTSQRPKPRYLVGRDARLQLWLKTLIPTRLTDFAVTRFFGDPRRLPS